MYYALVPLRGIASAVRAARVLVRKGAVYKLSFGERSFASAFVCH